MNNKVGAMLLGCCTLLGGLFALVYTSPLVHAAQELLPCALVRDIAERTLCYEDHVPLLLSHYTVEEIFNIIRQLQVYDPAIVDCHFVAHRLGEEMVATDPTRWAEYLITEGAETLCSFGYVHGVAIGAFQNDPMTDAEIEHELPLFKEVCNLDSFGEFRKINCYHGLGHMFYFLTGTDIEKSLRLCDRIHPIGSPEAPRCYAGVTMNLYMPLVRGGEVDARHLTIESAPPYCESLKEDRYIGACKRASWILQVDTFVQGTGIEAFCANQPSPDETDLCFQKIFHGLAWKLVNNPEQMARLCALMPSGRQKKCFTEAAAEFLITKGGVDTIDDSIAFCERAQHPAIVSACVDELARWGAYLYKNDASSHAKYCSMFDAERKKMCLFLEGRPRLPQGTRT